MSVHMRRVGEVAPNSVGPEQLQVGAVELDSDKVTGSLALDGSKISGQLPETKLGDLAVSVRTLQNNVVTLAKADNDLKTSHFLGDETPVESPLGTVDPTEYLAKQTGFAKVPSHYAPTKMRILATLHTNDVSYQATLRVYIDSEPTARAEFTSVSLTNELKSAEVDISDVATGQHDVFIKLTSDNAAGIAYNDFVEIKFVL